MWHRPQFSRITYSIASDVPAVHRMLGGYDAGVSLVTFWDEHREWHQHKRIDLCFMNVKYTNNGYHLTNEWWLRAKDTD